MHDFSTESRAAFVRHPDRMYAEREPPCDPAATGGALAKSRSMAVVDSAGRWAGETTRVASALHLGHDAPVYRTETMAATSTAAPALTRAGGFKRNALPFVPRACARGITEHPALDATRAAEAAGAATLTASGRLR